MKTYDTVVVGGGIIGLASAFYLPGRVAVLERGRAGREASWAAGGILTPIHLADYPDALANLAVLSSKLYPEFVREVRDQSGIDPELVVSGVLFALQDDADERHAQRLAAWKKRKRQPCRWLNPREARLEEPALGDFRGALLLPDIAQVRNNRLCRALATALRRRGVDLLEGTRCLAIEDDRVQTQKKLLSAGNIVVSTGAWAAELAERLGRRIPVEPVRGQMLLTQAAPGFLRRIVILKDQYVIPRLDGRILIGSTVEKAGFDKRVTLQAASFLARQAARMCPQIAALPLVRSWAGLRPGCPDRIPYIARHPEAPRVVVAAGHFRNGILLAPATGKLVSALVRGSAPPIDPKPFGFSR